MPVEPIADPRLLWVLALLVGAAVSLPLIRFGQRLPPATRARYWATNLVIAALIYVAAALVWGRPWLPRQLLGLAAYGALAVLGARRWPRLVAVGWLLHVAWDFLGHPLDLGLGAADGAFMPWWYPPACLGFDLFVAGALWIGLAPRPEAR